MRETTRAELPRNRKIERLRKRKERESTDSEGDID